MGGGGGGGGGGRIGLEARGVIDEAQAMAEKIIRSSEREGTAPPAVSSPLCLK